MNIKDIDKYKISLIYGQDDVNHNMKDGKIDCFGNMKDMDEMHIINYIDVIKKHFSDVKLLGKITWHHSPEVPAFFFSKLFNICSFMNTTKDIKRHGKTGVFVMPDELTERQIQSLLLLTKNIEDFKIQICYNLELNEGIIESKIISNNGIDKKTPYELMSHYIENIHVKGKNL